MSNFNLEQFDKAVLEGKATWWQMELPSGKVIFGDAKTEMLGYDSKDFNHYQDFMNLVDEKDKEMVMQAMRDHLEGKAPLYQTTYKIKTIKGDYLTFYDCGQITEKNGDNLIVMGFVLKIDDVNVVEKSMNEFKEMILKGEPSIIDIVSKHRN